MVLGVRCNTQLYNLSVSRVRVCVRMDERVRIRMRICVHVYVLCIILLYRKVSYYVQ